MRRADLISEISNNGKAGDIMARAYPLTESLALISNEIGPRYLIPSVIYVSEIGVKYVGVVFWKWSFIYLYDK